MGIERDGSEDDGDVEKAALLVEEPEQEPAKTHPAKTAPLSRMFWISAVVNCVATTGIVFVNKRIFENAALRRSQVTFAAYHFAVTAALLYVVSRPAISLFQAKSVDALKILPLSLSMIANVVLTNACLAFSSIQFYQISRVLITPCVALLNYLTLGATIPRPAALALVPVCVGVGIVSYFDAAAKGSGSGSGSKDTSPLGVAFAFTGVFASSVYTVWIGKYHKMLDCTSMQLLLIQSPVSILIMVYVIPFSDDPTVWRETTAPTWGLMALSGLFACLINTSQFVIINEAGPVSSTVIGHLKSITIVALGWIYSGKSVKDWTMVGVLITIGGIILYSLITQRLSRN